MTDQEIELHMSKLGVRWQSGSNGGFWLIEDADLHPAYRAIESAATAPLLAEIERLKERVAELEAQESEK